METTILEILSLAKFTNRKNLRLQLTARGFYLSDRELRRVIEKLITDSHYCISSSEKGYSLINTEEDLNDAMQYLKLKATSISIRANSILRNWKEKSVSSQIALFV